VEDEIKLRMSDTDKQKLVRFYNALENIKMIAAKCPADEDTLREIVEISYTATIGGI